MKKRDDAMNELADVRGSKAYEESRKAAESLAQNPDELEKFLENLEKKLAGIPRIGGVLSNIPVLVSMVRSYFKGEYPSLPRGTLIGILAALVYFVSPVDIIPDAIPGIGYLDDAMVVTVTMAFVKSDVDTYKQWRSEQKSRIDTDGEIK